MAALNFVQLDAMVPQAAGATARVPLALSPPFSQDVLEYVVTAPTTAVTISIGATSFSPVEVRVISGSVKIKQTACVFNL